MSTEVSLEQTASISQPAGERAYLPPLSMRTNFAWTLVGSGVYGACQWGMLIVLAKLGSAEMVGRFALALALCAPIVMFTNLQLRTVQATDARNEYRFRDYLTLRVIASAAAFTLIAAIATIAGYRFEVLLVVLVIALAKGVESISDVIYGLLQKRERLDLIAISMMLKGPGSLAAFYLLVSWTRSVFWGAVGLLAVWVAILFTYDARNARRIITLLPRQEEDGFRFQPISRQRLPVVWRLAWLSLPLGVVGLLDSLNVNLPRYLIEHELGEAALGHFAAMAYIIVAGNMVVGALAQSAAPRLSRRYVHALADYKRLVWKLVQFGVALGAAGLLASLFFGKQILTTLYKAEYASHVGVFEWLMAAAAIGYVARFLVCSMTAARFLRAQAPLYALSLVVLGALSFWLIPQRGLLGAAWALTAGMAALLIGAVWVNVMAVRSRATQGSDILDLPETQQELPLRCQ